MRKTPETMPEYTITESQKDPFLIKRKDLSGWFIPPMPGKKVEWSEYYMPDRSWYSTTEVTVEGRARIHGLEGLEILEYTTKEVFFHWEKRRTILQVTDTFQQPLAFCYEEAAYYPEDDYFIRSCNSFKDMDYYENKSWDLPYREEMSRKLLPAKAWERNGNIIVYQDREKFFKGGVAGYYDISFGDKNFHTICYMYGETKHYVNGDIKYIYEEYLDHSGKIVLLRTFWHYEAYIENIKEESDDTIPQEYLWVNNQLFVHYMDAISEYVV